MVGKSKGWGYLYVAELRQHPRIHLGPAETKFEPSRPIDYPEIASESGIALPGGSLGDNMKTTNNA